MSTRSAVVGSAALLLLVAARAFAGVPYQVADLAPGAADASMDTLRAAGTSVVFRRSGQDIWGSDGSGAGTVLLRGGYNNNPTTHGALVAFFAPSDTPPLEDLWFTDGTPAGTLRIASIAGDPQCDVFGSPCQPTDPVPDSLTSVGSLLYFRQNGYGVWRSDGTRLAHTASVSSEERPARSTASVASPSAPR